MPPFSIYLAHSGAHTDKTHVGIFRRQLAVFERQGRVSILERVDSVKNGSVRNRRRAFIEAYKQKMAPADLILLFVSPDALSNEQYIWEMDAAQEYSEAAGKTISPVVLRPCPWEETWLSNFQALPVDGKPLSQAKDPEAAWLSIVKRLAENYFPDPKEKPSPKQKGQAPFKIKHLTLENFKCFKKLSLSFDRSESEFDGQWTCIAGINGAGKSSVLEAICLALIGEDYAGEVGSKILGRKCRNQAGTPENALITLTVQREESETELKLALDPEGVDKERLPGGLRTTESGRTWDAIRRTNVLSFGATRNVSKYRTVDHDTKDDFVRRQMTLFDPLAQIADFDTMFERLPADSPLPEMLQDCFNEVLGHLRLEEDHTEIKIIANGRVSFEMDGAHLSMYELPDGFRSMATWIAGVCQAWLETYPEKAKGAKIQDVDGIVLLDEIDLHLHAGLQRVIVPSLRKCLPKVQWIVTTHSPLVLFSFDRTEILLLDAREETNVRQLDRQIMGFTIEQVYDWLMGIRPISAFIEEQLELAEKIRRGEKVDQQPLSKELIAMLMMQSPHVSEEEAKAQKAWLEEKRRQRKGGA